MALYRFTVSRVSLIRESYTVEADSEEQALSIADCGCIDYDNDQVGAEFVDYHDDNWEIDSKEDLCPLVKMIKAHSETTTS